KPAPGARPADSPSKPTAREESPPARVRDVDALKFPPGAILVICKEVKDALGLLPDGVLLSPDKYQALMERIEQLERQARQALPVIPTACKLTGHLEGDIVRFQVQFEFVTNRPKSVVVLGCQRAWLKPGATLDGHLPLLLPGEDGLMKVQ